jgi:type IV secretory pathway TrbD component
MLTALYVAYAACVVGAAICVIKMWLAAVCVIKMWLINREIARNLDASERRDAERKRLVRIYRD